MKRTTLSLPRFGAGPSLHRVARLARMAGLDLEAIGARSTVIVGSNGKGSTAKLLAASLETGFERVGLFTSPHLMNFNERFRIDSQPISDADLTRIEADVSELIEAYQADRPGDDVGEFEAWFLVAALWFQEQDCEACVFEAGIGGRLDPVRLLRAPLAILTSIDLEHTALLGPTLRHIAYDKLDVAPDGGQVITGTIPANEEAAVRAFCRMKQLQRAPAANVAGIEIETLESGLSQVEVTAPDGQHMSFETTLSGPFAETNLAMALAALSAITKRCGTEPDWDAVADRLAGLQMPGQFERLDHGPGVIIDTAHTPATLEAVARALTAGQRDRYVLLFGTSDTEKTAGMIEVAARHFDVAVLGTAHRGVPSDLLQAQFSALAPFMELTAKTGVEDALATALSLGETLDRPVAVLGGLFWAASMRAALLGEDQQDGVDFR